VRKIAEALELDTLQAFRERFTEILRAVGKDQTEKFRKDIVLSAKRGAELSRELQG